MKDITSRAQGVSVRIVMQDSYIEHVAIGAKRLDLIGRRIFGFGL
jgi:hypothetical protein